MQPLADLRLDEHRERVHSAERVGRLYAHGAMHQERAQDAQDHTNLDRAFAEAEHWLQRIRAEWLVGGMTCRGGDGLDARHRQSCRLYLVGWVSTGRLPLSLGETANAIFATPARFSKSNTWMTRPCSTLRSARITARRSGVFALAAFARGVMASSFGRSAESTRVLPSIESSTENTCCRASPLAAFGKSIGMPCETMMRAVTMKMMSNTSVTSTRGVTLMPAIRPSSSLPLPPAMGHSSSFVDGRSLPRALAFSGLAEGGGAVPASTPAKYESST